MEFTVKFKNVRRVDLTATAEDRLLEAAIRCGGGAVFNQAALERQMVETVALLTAIDDALLPPIIRDVVPRAN